MKTPPSHIAQFLDVEADDTDDDEREGTDDEAENDLMLQFFDDETVASDDEIESSADGKDRADGNDKEDEDWNNYLDRARIRGRREGAWEEAHYIENLLPFVTKLDDYPLWRIACRVGLEYTAMESLFRTAQDHHQIRSVVLRDSIPGYIYVEATMNMALTNLLLITPGILKSKGRKLIKMGIIYSEFTDVFRMENESTQFRKGVWVKIKQGLYRGDVGQVVGSKDWSIEVLVVPRLAKTRRNPQKRKFSQLKPSPDLFDPSNFPKAVQIADNEYTLGSLRLEHGLCRKVYDSAGLVGNVESITFPLFKKFLLSKHPQLFDIDIPRPAEWIFDVGERVEVVSSGRPGQVIAIYPLYLEVNLELDQITQSGYFVHDDHLRVRWYNIKKLFDIGNYVRVTGGPYIGDCGWVVRTGQTEATLNLAGNKRGGEGAPYKIEEVIIPINCLKLETPPHSCGEISLESGNAFVGREMQSPWIGRDVLITQEKHPSKGSIGTVKQVIRCDPEGKDLKFQVEFGNVIRPGLPFERIWISSESVKEAKHEFIRNRKSSPSPSTAQSDTSSEPERGLLHPCFEGLEIKAIVEGGVFDVSRERLIQIIKVDDRIILRTKNQRTIVTLEPSWVKVIHPNGRGDNNLLVFITGEHIGKFARRVYHRDGPTGPITMFLAFVERHANASDSLSGERTEAPMSHLAIVTETQAEKTQKNKLMESLRNEWRGK